MNGAARRTGVEWVTEAWRFRELREEWGELLLQSDADCPFLTWEWLFTWWKHLSGRARLRILCLREDGRLDAIAPFMAPPRFGVGMLRTPALWFLGSGSVGSDYLDLIVRRGREESCVARVADHLGRLGRSFGMPQVRGDRSAAAMLGDRLRAAGWDLARRRTHVSPFIRLSGHTWDTYRASLGPEHRRGFERKLRRLRRNFEVGFEQVVSEDARSLAMPRLVELHLARWSARGGSDAFHTPALVAFHQEVSRAALRAGWLRLYRLRLDGQTAAALYGFGYRGTFYFYQSGFDAAHERLGVGVVTMGLSIRSALEEGLSEFDLLHGAEPYKFHWARRTRPLVEYRLHPPGPAGWLAARAHRWERRARSFARGLMTERDSFSRDGTCCADSSRP